MSPTLLRGMRAEDSAGTLTAWFLRHGESEYNVRGFCNDDPHVEVPLTPHGKAMAAAVGDALGGVRFDAVFSSEFPRAIETAKLLLGRRLERLVLDARLNDRRTGFEGRPVEEYRSAIAADPLRLHPSGGESFEHQKARVLEFLADLQEMPYRRVLIISHHEPLRILLGHLLSIDDNSALRLRIGNCEGFRTTWERDGEIEGDILPRHRCVTYIRGTATSGGDDRCRVDTDLVGAAYRTAPSDARGKTWPTHP